VHKNQFARVMCLVLLLSFNAIAHAGINDDLLQAAESGNANEVSRLIANGANVDAEDNNGVSALLGAAHFGYKEIVELLIAKGANIDASTKDGITPLYEAARMGNSNVADVLISHGANLNAKSKSGYSPLFIAILSGKKDISEALISKGADVNSRDNKGNTPLHAAAYKGYKDIAELLVAKGADVNARGGDEITPLYQASMSGNVDMANFLIAHGANINAKSKSGYTPLLVASSNGDKDVVDLLIAKGADVNAKDNQGNTSLFWAIKTFFAMSPENLKIKSANDQQKLMAIKKQVKGEWREVAVLLIKHGADVAITVNDATPMYVAALMGDKDLIESLADKGADPSNGGGAGETPLHAAIAEGHLGAAKLLIGKGADVNAKNTRSGRTPLHFLASFKDDRELAELMITKGADVNAMDKDGRTPLSYAVEKGNNAVAEVLRQHGGK
jgi:ankyrin repeat protein